MASCYFCGDTTIDPKSVGRSSVCPSCGKDLKICRNCVFYDRDSHWECRETVSERVRDKDRSNFCDFFRFSGTNRGAGMKSERVEKARSDVMKLFGDD